MILLEISSLGEEKEHLKAISYNKLILKIEKGGFRTFAGVFDLGNGRIGPALLKVRLAFLRDASDDVCRLFRRGVIIFADTPYFPRNQFRTLFIPKYAIFSDETVGSRFSTQPSHGCCPA